VGASDIHPDTVASRSPEAIAGSLIEETILIDARADRYLRLNRTGAWLWERLAEPASASELSSGLAVEFGIAEERATADVSRFLKDMSGRGLIDLRD
jgi:coenzyme PQQ synthesis protein D (PqqD)